MTRRILKACVLMMGAEKRKRVMPRHLMTAMVQLGIIPIRVLEG
jgi:hypothetical protein